MNNNHSATFPASRLANELMFSVNLALAIAATFFIVAPARLTYPFFRIDADVSRYLGLIPDTQIPKDSYTMGYFALLLAIVVAAIIWCVLRLLLQGRFLRAVLCYGAGLAAIAAAPGWWLFSTYVSSHRYGWTPIASIQFYELCLAAVVLIVYFARKLPGPAIVGLALLLLHYGFWLWQYGRTPFFLGCGGPVAAVTALLAGLAWWFYLRDSSSASPNAWNV
jgi:hypothetical protein